jgi:hypothetical protein
MVFDQIDKVKEAYTDKYVVVDGSRPELARFKDIVGRVKTVNMGGRALVEFLDYHLNIGWYDIDIDFLKVVDKPLPKPEKPEVKKTDKPAAKKAAAPAPGGEKKLSPLEMARAQGAAKAEGAAAPAKPAAKPAGGKLSTADILAAARGGAAAPAKQEVPPPPQKPETPSMHPAEEESNVADEPAPAPAAAPKLSGEKVDRSQMSVDQMIAWCREHDGK